MLICPKCGNTSDKIDFIGIFCIKCEAGRISVKWPKEIEYEQCARCERMKIKGLWTKDRKVLDDFIISKCKGEFSSVVYDYDNDDLIFLINKERKNIRVTRKLDLFKTVVTCIDCSRLSGGYFEAIIQLRGDKARVEKYLNKLDNALGAKLLKAGEVKGGADLYSVDNKLAMQLLNKLELRYILTKKLVGEREGKRLYRTSYSVRL